ncbi:pentapeptide repeat-containing protein [Amorphoplanes nipponensis]|uniref:Pentapeptide repeat-containing protein n=1 Tax=Actinoplanes nipponensis TaxID=135950 RepID=A0A919JKP3_9ACTN|nr:pentapeptide repeat-containing protein [Actinoplanes nipponensis]GIE52769.1 hypothetical protein Ani05nite_63030 [Actinoplanes nipponensis]
MRRLPPVVIAVGGILVLLFMIALIEPRWILRLDLGSDMKNLRPPEMANAINQIRSTVIQAVGSVVVLSGAYVGWRQLQHNMHATQAQIELQRAGHLTDRYTRVVEQLASTDETIRVGAIHALDRIAAEAVTERAGVVALLATYVRTRAHRGWTSLDDPHLPLRSRASDIQAALTTLTHWIEPGHVPPQWLTADIAHTDLPNANLHGCTLWHVRMRDVNLTGAALSEVDLRGADLRGAILDNVDFTGSYANRRTWWPAGFDPTTHGITIEQSEDAYEAWPPKTPDI